MSKRTVFILVAIAAALTAFSLALSRRDSRDWRSNRAGRLLPFPWRDAASVTATRPDGRTLRFSRVPGGEWTVQLADGVTDTLGAGATEGLAALATLTRRDPLPDRTPPPEDGTALTLVAQNFSGRRVRLDFGELQGNVRSVVVDGDRSVVYGVNQELLSFLNWPDTRLRNMRLAAAPGFPSPHRVTLSPSPGDPSMAVTLLRRPRGWRLVEPVDWPADPARMDSLLRWLERMRATAVADEKPESLEKYGLDKPNAFVEVRYATNDGEALRRIEFGADAPGGGVYAKARARTPVFVAPKESLAEISLLGAAERPSMWRNYFRRRTVNLLSGGEPAVFTLRRLLPEPATLTLTKKGAVWEGELTGPDGAKSRFPVDPPTADASPLASLAEALSGVRVKSFLSDTVPEEGAVSHPAWRLSCRFADGSESPVLTLYAANAEGDLAQGRPFAAGSVERQPFRTLDGFSADSGIPFTVSDNPGVMETFPGAAYQLCYPLYRYRSRRILEYGPREAAAVTVLTPAGETAYFRRLPDENGQWWRNPASPAPLLDDNNRFDQLITELSRLRSEGFVSDGNGDIREFGLDRPEITAIVYSSPPSGGGGSDAEGRLFTLSVGKAAGLSGDRYARLDDGGPVFVISEKLASALTAEYR